MRQGFCISDLTALIVALALLGGCAATPGGPGRDAGCEVRRDTEMTLRRARGFILAPAVLDDRPVQMVLDTGSEISTISPAVARDFGLPEDRLNGRVLRGVGGDVRTGSVLARGFAIGDLPPEPARFSLNAADLLPSEEPPVAGLLGADRLAGRDLDLDTPNLRAALYTVRGCPSFHPFPDNKGVAVARTASGLSFVVADLDGNGVRALLDTGARGSFMTKRLATSLGVTEAMLAADPRSVKIGISRSEIEVRQHRFERISLGAVSWQGVTVGVADVALPGVDMLLGADLLGRQRIWLSPARAMLWLR